MGAYQQVAEKSEADIKNKENPKDELKGVSGVKDRMGAFTQPPEDSNTKLAGSDSPQLDAVRKTSSVQKGKQTWAKVAEEQPVASHSDSSVVAERTAEAKVGGSLKDRLGAWNMKASADESVGVRKEPIKIDYGF